HQQKREKGCGSNDGNTGKTNNDQYSGVTDPRCKCLYNMKKILVISTASTHFKALLQYCNVLRPHFNIEFLFDQRHNPLHDQVNICKGLGYSFHIMDNAAAATIEFDPNFFEK